jgi:hypothetical protein
MGCDGLDFGAEVGEFHEESVDYGVESDESRFIDMLSSCQSAL